VAKAARDGTWKEVVDHTGRRQEMDGLKPGVGSE